MTKRPLWFRFVVLGLLTIVLVACEQIAPGGTSTPVFFLYTPTPSALPLPSEASTAARIRARGYLLVGVRYDDAPFGVVEDSGGLVGFDVDLAREFAARWLGDPQAVKFVQVTHASAVERIRTRQVDLIVGALPHTQSAARDMDFSAAYYYDGLALLVHSNRPVTSTVIINGPGNLGGLAVGVVEESDAEAPLLRAAGGAAPRVIYYPDYFSVVAGLENGVIEALVGPRRTLARLSTGTGGLGLTPPFTRDPYAIGLPKNDGPFRDLVNVTLMNVLTDGTYATLFQHWFPGESPPDLEVWTGTSRLSFEDLGDTLTPPPSTIQTIETRGYLVVGLLDDQLPFGDFDANGVARGFEAELVRALAGRWLGDVAAVQFAQHTEESGIAALATGQIDLLAAHLPHTLPRDDEIDFSVTIYQGGIGLLVNSGSGVGGLTGLSGGSVAVSAEGGIASVVQQAAVQAGVPVSVQVVNDLNAALTGLTSGTYRAYADWRSRLLNLAYTQAGFLVLGERLTRRPIALGLRQNDAAFRDLVDFTLQALVVEGRFAALYDDWFGTDPPFAVQVWPGAAYRPLKLNWLPPALPTAVP